MVEDNRIVAVWPHWLRARAVVIRWTSQPFTRTYDLDQLVTAGSSFASLADPRLFSQVHVIEHGRYIAWGEDMVIPAEWLWEAKPVS